MEFERKALTEKRGLIPQIEPRYRYPYFSHIFDGGYSAGYYFYTWAEVLDKDAFEAFRESGDLFNKKIAGDFRRKILARGGSEDGMTMEQYMDKFKVPFVIWANYPLTGEKPGITSLNFLAQYVLRDAGIQTSAFGSYLWNLTKTIPAMTFAGYFDSEGNAYSHLETTEMTDLIRQYQTVQYNELFGGTDRQSSLFAAPVS